MCAGLVGEKEGQSQQWGSDARENRWHSGGGMGVAQRLVDACFIRAHAHTHTPAHTESRDVGTSLESFKGHKLSF